MHVLSQTKSPLCCLKCQIKFTFNSLSNICSGKGEEGILTEAAQCVIKWPLPKTVVAFEE